MRLLERIARPASFAWFITLTFVLACGGGGAPQKQKPKSSADASHEPVAGALAPGEPMTPLPVEADDARTGADTAEVTLIAFLDYQCRYCRETFDVLSELRGKYAPETLRIVYKHLPLEEHEMAVPAAIAAQAVTDEAGPQAFLQFSKLAFDHQAELSYVTLAEWASGVGVPRSVYNEAVSSEVTLNQVASDARLAWRRGAEGTPTLFVNGRLLAGAPSQSELSRVVDEELAGMRALSGAWAARYGARVQQNAEASLATALLAEDPIDYRVPVADSASLGPADAPVNVVVFTDYQCPYCTRADVTLGELRERLPTDIRLVWKHLPLPFHDQARPAARLAEAVRRKGGDQAFFQVSRELFEHSPKLDLGVFVALGKAHGLDEASVKLAVSGDDRALEERIARDLELADDVQAAGTPHVFINGKRLAGARPLEHFEAIVLAEKKRAAERLAAGVSPRGLYDNLQTMAVQPGAPTAIEPPPVDPSSPTRGPKTAPVTVHVFSDFECPYCRQAEQTLLELERQHAGQLRVVWHDRPLDFHPLARPAARAGREAKRQGGDAAFWKLHALLFGLEAGKAQVSRSDILGHAKALRLDVAAMEKAIDSAAHDADIDRDIELATKLGFQGTPAFVVGRYALTGARDLRHFERLVDLSLAPSPQP